MNADRWAEVRAALRRGEVLERWLMDNDPSRVPVFGIGSRVARIPSEWLA